MPAVLYEIISHRLFILVHSKIVIEKMNSFLKKICPGFGNRLYQKLGFGKKSHFLSNGIYSCDLAVIVNSSAIWSTKCLGFDVLVTKSMLRAACVIEYWAEQ